MPEVKQEPQDEGMLDALPPSPKDVALEDDPIVNEAPVYLNGGVRDGLVLLQYPTRRRYSPAEGGESTANTAPAPVTGLRIKPRSQVVETQVATTLPIQYLDASRLNPDGTPANLQSQPYQGILKPAAGRYAIGRIGADGSLRLSMVSRCGQLRPHFAAQDAALDRAPPPQQSQPDKGSDPAPVRSVQLSVKSSTDQTVKFSGVLEFWKQANKEEFESYQYLSTEEAPEFDDGLPDEVAATTYQLPATAGSLYFQ